jgi:hypothetical protein
MPPNADADSCTAANKATIRSPRRRGRTGGADHRLFDKREPDPERCASAVPIFRPYLPMGRLDNGARDQKSHAFRQTMLAI